MSVKGARYWLKDYNVEEVTVVVEPYTPCMPLALVEVAKAKRSERRPVVKFGQPKPPDNAKRVNMRFEILKADEAKQEVYGYAYVANEADLDTDAMTPEELKKAAHSLMENLSRGTQKGTGAGVNHEKFENIGHLVESAYDIDGSLGKAHGFVNPLPDAWFIGMKLSDETWKLYKEGKVTGFSIGGYADRVPIDDEKKNNVISNLVNRFKRNDKDFASDYTFDQMAGKIDELIWILHDTLIWILLDSEVTDKREAISESIRQFRAVMIDSYNLLPDFNDLDKAKEIVELIEKLNKTGIVNIDLKDHNQGDMLMEKSDVKELIIDVLKAEGLYRDKDDNKVAKADFQKAIDDMTTTVTEANKKLEGHEASITELTEVVTKLSEGIEAIVDKINKYFKTPGIRKSDDDPIDDNEPTKKTKDGVAVDKEGNIDWKSIMKGTVVDKATL